VSRAAWLVGTLATLAAEGTGYVVGHGENPVPALAETVPISPWTLAPSDSRQFPAIVSLVLKR
jgi:Cu(I)/Ag(I) efflux system membrane fusion protein